MNREHRILATTAAALRASSFASLSSFEVDLIDEITMRRFELGDLVATMTEAEAAAVADAVLAMKKHLQDQVAQQAAALGQALGRAGAHMAEAGATFRVGVAMALEKAK